MEVCQFFSLYNFSNLQSVLKHIDALIYLDADTLVFGNLSRFWLEFSNFDETQIAGAAQNTEPLHTVSMYEPTKGHPYFGPRGMFSGIF